MRRAWVSGLLGVMLVSAVATAADRSVLGSEFLVRDLRSGSAVGVRVVVAGREAASTDEVVGEPAASGAAVTVFARGATSSQATFAVPGQGVGGGWKVRTAMDGTLVFARYRDAVGIHGPVRRIDLRKTSGGMLSVRVLVEGVGIGIVPPGIGSEGGLVLALGGGDRLCVGLGGAAGGTIEHRRGVRGFETFRITDAAVEVPCFLPPATTTTTSSSTTTTSTSLPSCGSAAFPTCSGYCSTGGVCQAHRLLDYGTDACVCVPPFGICSQPYTGGIPPGGCDPVCPPLFSGPCPAGQVCVAVQNPAGFEGTGIIGCTDLPLCIDGPWPACGGRCPGDGVCQAVDVDFGFPEHVTRCLCPPPSSSCSCATSVHGFGLCPEGQVCSVAIDGTGACTAAACVAPPGAGSG